MINGPRAGCLGCARLVTHSRLAPQDFRGASGQKRVSGRAGPPPSPIAVPSARQQAAPARMVLRTAYNPEGPSQWIAGKSGTPAVLLPYTVGGTPAAKDLVGLFDDTLQRLLQAVR